MSDAKIVITGTGRAGTTLLVQILTALGLDTGVGTDKLAPYMPSVRAGLECRVDDPDAPTVVKDMTLGFRIEEVLDRGTVAIAHVLLPSRRIDIATASRIRAANYGRLPVKRGALTGTLEAREQQEVLENMRDRIVTALEAHGIPFTVLEFPRFALDAGYAFAELGFLVPDLGQADFEAALHRCVRPDLIHERPLSRRERWRTMWTSAWMRYVRFPIARVREWWNPEKAQARLRASVAESRRREAAAAAEEQGVQYHRSPGGEVTGGEGATQA